MSKTRSVITLGSFDGVHRGHQAILQKIVARARALKAIPAALVFNMPPRFLHANESPRFLLTTLAEKKKLLQRLGIRRIQVLEFDKKTAATSPQDFFRDTIVRRHRAAEMVVGPRIAFGKDRAGTLALLQDLGQEAGVRIHVVPGVGSGERVVSSSGIRELLNQGEITKAAQALGYSYELSGTVTHGDQRGRTLGFPTANLAVDTGKILPPGVFWVYIEPVRLHGICNIGTRPTFKSAQPTTQVEVFIFGPPKSFYGCRLTLRFLRRVRSEKRFASAPKLVDQIKKDVEKVKQWIKNDQTITRVSL